MDRPGLVVELAVELVFVECDSSVAQIAITPVGRTATRATLDRTAITRCSDGLARELLWSMEQHSWHEHRAVVVRCSAVAGSEWLVICQSSAVRLSFLGEQVPHEPFSTAPLPHRSHEPPQPTRSRPFARPPSDSLRSPDEPCFAPLSKTPSDLRPDEPSFTSFTRTSRVRTRPVAPRAPPRTKVGLINPTEHVPATILRVVSPVFYLL